VDDHRIVGEARTWYRDSWDPSLSVGAWFRMMYESGWGYPTWPERWSGKGLPTSGAKLVRAERRAVGALGPPSGIGPTLLAPMLFRHGTAEQCDRFLRGMAYGGETTCQMLSEPDAGSDLASLRTTAVRDGDDWVVNGQKTWTTLGQHGDWIFTLVRTDPEVKKQAGISMLLIDMTTPGVEVRPIELIDGGHEVNEVWFTDVRVPGDLLVGELNGGWTIAKFLLGNERVGVAPVGATKRALAALKANAGPLMDDPLVRARVAELENDLLALELTALRVVAHSSDGAPHPASSVLKLRGTELQQAVSELALDLAGPASLAAHAGDDSPQEGWARRSAPTYLNLRKASIYGGSNEIQRQIISRTILGL